MASCLEIVNESSEDKNVPNDLPPELLLQLENINLGENKTKERDKIFVPEWLKMFESPFLWHSQSKRGDSSETIILKTLEKIEELKLEEPELTLQHFVLLLKLVLEYYVLNDMEKSWATMKTVEDDFESVVSGGSPECECNDFKMPLGHMIFTSKAHLLMLVGDERQSQQISKDIIPAKVMPVQGQAAMWALKARFYLYAGYENGETIGVQAAEKALEMDPNKAEWHYLLAKSLRQERKGIPFCDEVPKRELVLLEKAVELKKDVKYMIYLAQAYMESGTKAFHKHRHRSDFYNSPLNQTILTMQQQALNLYKEALGLKPKSPSTLRRIGYGIMNLPRKIAEYDLALECLQKSLDTCYSSITMHMLGTYYHRYAEDDKKALEYFEKIAKEECHAGLSDMLRVKYKVDPTYDPCKDLEWGLSWKQKQKNRSLFLVQLGAYYLFIKRDLLKSISYFSQVIEEDKDSIHMTTFKSFFLRMFEPIDMYKYITNEAMLFLQKTGESKSLDDSTSSEEENNHTIAQIGCVEDLLCKISDIRPELMEMTGDPTLVDTLIETSKEIVGKGRNKNQNNNNRERHFNRGGFKGNQRDRGGPHPNQRGRGNRAGREGFQQRAPVGDNAERRGRFSVANQRDNADHEPKTDDRGNRTRPSNWRQRQNSSGEENDFKKGNRHNDSENNWRKH